MCFRQAKQAKWKWTKSTNIANTQPLSWKYWLLTPKLLAIIAVITPLQPYASSSEIMQSSTSPSPGPPENGTQFSGMNSTQLTSHQSSINKHNVTMPVFPTKPCKRTRNSSIQHSTHCHATWVSRFPLGFLPPTIQEEVLGQLQTEHLESIQKRAIHIIYPFTRGMSYSNILFVAELTSLESTRDQFSRSFFQDISHPSSSLYHLLPPPRDTSDLSRLRTATRFTRTKKYCSFINYALNHYQVPPHNN